MPAITLPRQDGERQALSAAVRGEPAARPAWHADPEVGLMLRVQADDEEAFGELTRRYAARVFGYFCRRLGDRAEAEDFTQEVFLRLFRARTTYRPRARLATWVFHITQNVARNAIRSRRRRPCIRLRLASEGDEGGDCLRLARSEPPSRPLEREEVAVAVRAAVAALGRRQRLAVQMHQFEDRSYAEVAARLAMTPKAVKSLLYRARHQLRDRLEWLEES
jgi:RNA polymerase sigma-70 factor (ECF subfamily)